MRDERAVGTFDDLALLLVAVLAFSLFFASLAAAYVQREARAQGERLQATAESLLAAVLDDPRWTAGRGLLVANRLANVTAEALAESAAGHPFLVTVHDLTTGSRWSFAAGSPGGDRRTAATSANLLARRVDAARVTATVWGP